MFKCSIYTYRCVLECKYHSSNIGVWCGYGGDEACFQSTCNVRTQQGRHIRVNFAPYTKLVACICVHYHVMPIFCCCCHTLATESLNQMPLAQYTYTTSAKLCVNLAKNETFLCFFMSSANYNNKFRFFSSHGYTPLNVHF